MVGNDATLTRGGSTGEGGFRSRGDPKAPRTDPPTAACRPRRPPFSVVWHPGQRRRHHHRRARPRACPRRWCSEAREGRSGRLPAAARCTGPASLRPPRRPRRIAADSPRRHLPLGREASLRGARMVFSAPPRHRSPRRR
eukprot:scaffold189_cov249-Pinguiococcus_pyrenoidosus.AAC.7